MEARFPVMQWTVDSLPIWPLARIRWFFSEWNRHYLTAAAPAASRAAGLAMRIATGPFRTMLAQRRTGGAHARQRRDLLFLTDGVSYAQVGGRWLERFCDPINRAAAKRGLTSTFLSPSYIFRDRLLMPAAFIQSKLDRANALGALRTRLAPHKAQLPALDELRTWAQARGFTTGHFTPQKLTSDAMRVRALARVYARFLRRTRPRLAFVISYYGVEGMAFVLACREAGVTVVDVQHGVQGELHPAYARLPKPVGRTHALVPDVFWVWAEADRRVIAAWAEGTGHRAVVGGNPWLHVWQEPHAWEGADEAGRRADAMKARAGKLPATLISLGWGLHPREQLEPMRSLIEQGKGRFVFWVRLHPSMLERREEIRALLNIAAPHELDEPTDLPLPLLLSHSAVHVTHSSTVAVEAAQFGVRTLVTSALGAELYAGLAETGWIVEESEDIARMLAQLETLAAQRQPRTAVAVPLEAALDELLFL